MEEFSFLMPLLLAIGGLLVGALLKSLLRHSRVPYTVALFAVGLLVGLADRNGLFHAIPRLEEALVGVANINPDFILYIFLPVLIFDAAYELNLHIFKKTLANAALLAVPGLIICMVLTALLLVGIRYVVPGYEQWTWAFALMFGALISATDPVAVVALLHELKTSKRFSTLVDAESLLNDGTGIVCFMLFFGVYTAAGESELSPVMQFIQVVAGGVLLGYMAARLVIWFITRVNSEELVQNSVIILAAYLVFILSQYYLGLSGVIALVAFGLTVTYIGKPRLKPRVNEFMETFWELLTYMANTLVFIIVGVVIAVKVDFSWSHFAILLLLYVALNLFRFVMIMLLYPLMKHLGYGLNRRESFILTWGGLRGALGLTLALMVSYTPAIPESIRSQVLFFTAGIVTLTLCVNATTTRWLLGKLGLTHVPSARILMERLVQERIRESSEKYFDRLQGREPLAGANWKKVARYIAPQPDTTRLEKARTQDVLAELRLRLLDREKAFSREIYEEGIISQTAFRRLMNSLDELYDHDGSYPLDVRHSIFNFCSRTRALYRVQKLPYFSRWAGFYFRERIMVIYDLGRGFIILQREDLKLLDELVSSGVVQPGQAALLQTLRREIEHNIESMNRVISRLSADFPKAYNHALTQKAIRMMLSNERRVIRQMQTDGVLSDKDAAQYYARVDERSDEVNSFTHTIPASILRWLFHRQKS